MSVFSGIIRLNNWSVTALRITANGFGARCVHIRRCPLSLYPSPLAVTLPLNQTHATPNLRWASAADLAVDVAHPFAGCQQRRSYFRKKTVKVPPTKPLNFDYAGDANPEELILDMTQPRLGFEDCQELLEADDVVKKLYSLEFGNGQDCRLKRIDELLCLVREHPAEVQSLEVKIARLTATVKNQIEHCLAFRKDKVAKAQLVERIQCRRQYLKRLRRVDVEKYEWLLARLEIRHVPTPTPFRKPYKRELREAAVRDRATAIRDTAIADLRQRLDAERLEFAQFKTSEMEAIRADAATLGADLALPLAEALATVGVAVPTNQREPAVWRRTLLLRKKFALYAHKAVLPDRFIV